VGDLVSIRSSSRRAAAGRGDPSDRTCASGSRHYLVPSLAARQGGLPPSGMTAFAGLVEIALRALRKLRPLFPPGGYRRADWLTGRGGMRPGLAPR
jgi:hypothetical protein